MTTNQSLTYLYSIIAVHSLGRDPESAWIAWEDPTDAKGRILFYNLLRNAAAPDSIVFYLLLFYQLLDGDKLAVPTNGCNVGHAREGMRPNANYMVTMTGRPVTKVLESITPRQSVHTLMHPIIEVTAWGADWRLQVAMRNNEGFS